MKNRSFPVMQAVALTIALLISFILLIVHLAQSDSVKDRNFIWHDDTIVGLSETGKMQTELIIPVYCTEIQENALCNNDVVEFLSISANTDVGENAFIGCDNLKDVTVTGGSDVDLNAFYYCNSLEHVTVTGKEARIGEYMFCEGVTEVPSVMSDLIFVGGGV